MTPYIPMGYEELCDSNYVVVATIIQELNPTNCDKTICKDPEHQFDDRTFLLKVDRVLREPGRKTLELVPGDLLNVAVKRSVTGFSALRIYDRRRRPGELNLGVSPDVSLTGSKQVFLLNVEPKSVTAVGTEHNVSIAKTAIVPGYHWFFGQEDMRMLYTIKGGYGTETTLTPDDKMLCRNRYIDPCYDGFENMVPKDLYLVATSLKSSPGSVECAIHGLASFGEEAVPTLRNLLRVGDEAIVWDTMKSIERIGPDAKRILPDLMKVIQNAPPKLNGDFAWSVSALLALGEGAKPAIPELIRLSRAHPDNEALTSTLISLAKFDSTQIVDYFVERLQQEEEFEVSYGSYEKFVKLAPYDPKQIAATIIEKARRLDASCQTDRYGMDGALLKLAEAYPTLVMPYFIEKLNSDCDSGQLSLGLRKIGSAARVAFPSVEKKLRQALERHQWILVPDMVECLAAIGSEDQVFGALVPLLSDANTAVAAATALGHMRARAIPVAGDLMTRMHDESEPIMSRIAFADALLDVNLDNDDVVTFLLKQRSIAEFDGVANAIDRSLAKIQPMPVKYVSDLMKVIKGSKFDIDDLCKAYEHTGQSLSPGYCVDGIVNGNFVKFHYSNPNQCVDEIHTDQSEPQVQNPCECAPSYTRAAFWGKESGNQIVEFDIDLDGHLIDLKLAGSSGFKQLDRAALTALSHCKFLPALVKGEPSRGKLRKTIRWVIDEKRRAAYSVIE